MNSQNVISTAFAHQEPDKVPIDFNGHRSSRIWLRLMLRLPKNSGITTFRTICLRFHSTVNDWWRMMF